MITLTLIAINQLKSIAESENILNLTVRVKIIGNGCAGFSYDMYFEDVAPTDFDELFEQEEIKIIVDPLSLQYLDGTEIDYVEDFLSGGFKFNNPNVTGTCGCQSSVSF